MSVAVTSRNDSNSYQQWLENDVSDLVKELEKADTVIGFNIVSFDYEVLSAYVPNTHKLLDKKSFDILADLESRLGFRVSLENLCSATLGKSKLGKAEDAIKWFRQGQIDKIVRYCRGDVELTRAIYRYGQKNRHICYPQFGQPVKLHVDWD